MSTTKPSHIAPASAPSQGTGGEMTVEPHAVAALSGPPDEMLTKKELAAKLKVTVRCIENWQRAGHLPFIKVSTVVRFHWPEVVAQLKSNFQICRRGGVRPRTGI